MTIVELPDAADLVPPEADDAAAPSAGPDHPMRKVTHQVAFEEGWSPDRARKVADLFDGLAADWSAKRRHAPRMAPVADALRRGAVDVGGRWLELGSGTGLGTEVLAPAVDRLVALDLSAEMLANAPADLAPRVRGDSARLPFPAAAFDGLLLVNMLLFPAEVHRVLTPGGRLIWVNSLGDRTPIHLSPAELLDALPGSWSAITARSGSGFWVSAQR